MQERIINDDDLKSLGILYEIQDGHVLKILYETDGIGFKAKVVEFDVLKRIVKESKTYGPRLLDEDINCCTIDSSLCFVLKDALFHVPFYV